MSKSCRTEITIRAGNQTKSVYSALAPDIKKLQGKNEIFDMSLKGSLMTFSIETDDLSSLRANVNSYLRLADASLKCIESSTL